MISKIGKHQRTYVGHFLLIGLLGIFSSCDLLQIKEEADSSEKASAPLARVFDKNLFPEDLTGITPEGSSEQDSIFIIEKYIDKWIKQQLLIAEAESKIQIDKVELDRKVENLRYELMAYEYQKYYISKELNTEVSDDEVQTYYTNNIDNFILKQNIIKGIFIKLPKEAPKIYLMKKLIRSKKEEDQEELKSYCYRYATTYILDDKEWINFDEIIANTPLVGIPNKVQYLRRNKYVETSDDKHIYVLKINEYKISDQNSPMEIVVDQIKAIIKNKRKVTLASKLEDDIYKRARTNNDFEIY